MTEQNETQDQNVKQDTVILDCKVQTIYYENSAGKILRHHEVSDTRITNKDAKEILELQGANVNIVLRVLTERVGIELTRAELQEKLTHSERFYQRKN